MLLISFLSIVMLIILIDSNCEANNLCNMKIFVSDQAIEIDEFKNMNYFSDATNIYADTFYHVICITNETIRSRNLLKLAYGENNDEMDLSEYQSIQLSNETLNSNHYSYLKGKFIINSNDLKVNFNIFCRFLTSNPSIYCEKEIKLSILSFSSTRFIIFIVTVLLSIALGAGLVFAKRFSKSKNHEIQESEKNYFRFFNLKNKKTTNKSTNESNSTHENATSNQQFQIFIPINSEPYESIEVLSSEKNDLYLF
jgi:hypothetical protein